MGLIKGKELRELLDTGITGENSSNYWRIKNLLVAKCMIGKVKMSDTIQVKDLIIALDKADARWEKEIDKYCYRTEN